MNNQTDDISQYYGGSNYLKAADLQGREVRVTINHWEPKKLGQDERPKLIIYFEGKEKGMVLNTTNAYAIADAYGCNPNDWIGKSIFLYGERTRFQGQSVMGLRVRPDRAAQPQQQLGSSARRGADDPISSGPNGSRPVNEDIPF